jgi:hypothetical protein
MTTISASEARALRKQAKQAKPKKKPVKSEHSKLLDKADKYFSLWYRANEADEQGLVKCCTCRKILRWKAPDRSTHLGHWKSRGRNSTRFDVKNVGVQCYSCNKWEEGNKPLHRAWLEKKYGVEEIARIEILSVQQRDMSNFELETIAQHFKTEYQKICKLKGL